MWYVLGISLLSGMSTPLGGLLVLYFRELSTRMLAFVLGLATGIMITVVLTDLMPTALSSGTRHNFLLGFALGWVFLWILRKIVDWVSGPQVADSQSAAFSRLGWFISIAMALHDLPEGIAIGAGDAVRRDVGLVIALAIALHNIPEGMSIAAPLRLSGMSKTKVFWITFITGWVTPLGTLISLGLFQISNQFISLALACASGAMIYVVTQDILPHSLAQDKRQAVIGGIVGAALMVTMHMAHA